METEEEAINVSDSQINTWQFCPRSWYLQYVEGWRKITLPRALLVGSLFHLGVEATLKYLYRNSEAVKMDEVGLRAAVDDAINTGGDVIANAISEYRAELGKRPFTIQEEDDLLDIEQTVYWMVRHYMMDSVPFLLNRIPIGIEFPFEELVHDGVNNRGIMDFLLFDPFEGVIYLVDHKSSGDLPNAMQRLEYSRQSIGYESKLKELISNGTTFKTPWGAEIGVKGTAKIRCLYRLVRSKKPKDPKILKDGSVSSAAVSTTKEFYSLALSRQFNPPTEKQIARLDSLPETWTATVEPIITSEEKKIWESDLLVEAQRILQARKLPIYATRTPARCPDCNLKGVCHTGSDPDYHQVKEEKKDATT